MRPSAPGAFLIGCILGAFVTLVVVLFFTS